jgi:molybdopterin-guanine dinucleotide biosynthesis protein A
MGRDKASLSFGDETLLARTMRLVAEVVPREQIVLVAAAEQRLPSLPWEATVVRDRAPDQGPLPAIVDGLTAFDANVSSVFVTACDAPLLQPVLIEHLFRLLAEDVDAVIPVELKRLHSLFAVYRPRVAEQLRSQFLLGTSSLFRAIHQLSMKVRWAPVEELREVDPELLSFWNCNTEEEYLAALERLS